MDKAKVIDEVEDALAQIIPIITGKKSNYRLNKKQKAKLNQTLDLQEKNYNLDYNSMDINEQKKRLKEFLLDFSETVFGVRNETYCCM